jgi:hypothetical protein
MTTSAPQWPGTDGAHEQRDPERSRETGAALLLESNRPITSTVPAGGGLVLAGDQAAGAVAAASPADGRDGASPAQGFNHESRAHGLDRPYPADSRDRPGSADGLDGLSPTDACDHISPTGGSDHASPTRGSDHASPARGANHASPARGADDSSWADGSRDRGTARATGHAWSGPLSGPGCGRCRTALRTVSGRFRVWRVGWPKSRLRYRLRQSVGWGAAAGSSWCGTRWRASWPRPDDSLAPTCALRCDDKGRRHGAARGGGRMPERRPARANLQPRAVGGARAPDRPAGRPAPDRSIAHPCALPGGHARPGRHRGGGATRGPSAAGCHPSGRERRAVDGDRVALVAKRDRNGGVTRSRSWRRIVNRVGGPRRS